MRNQMCVVFVYQIINESTYQETWQVSEGVDESLISKWYNMDEDLSVNWSVWLEDESTTTISYLLICIFQATSL